MKGIDYKGYKLVAAPAIKRWFAVDKYGDPIYDAPSLQKIKDMIDSEKKQ